MQHYLGKIVNGEALLNEEELHHIKDVRRVELHEEIEVGDGSATYRCVVTSLHPLRIEVLEKEESREIGKKVVLCFAYLKSDHNELIIQKGTELGVTSFVPMITARTIAKPDGKEEAKLSRLRKIAQESAKQCRREVVPEVLSFARLDKALSSFEGKLLFAYEGDFGKSNTLYKELVDNTDDNIIFFVGPEGGWNDKEVMLAKEAGAHFVSLGKRILRAETAAIYCASIASSILEEDHE